MILAGFVALGNVVAFTLVSVLFIGAAFLVGGVFQIVQVFMTKGWRDFAFSLSCGVLTTIGGVLIMQEPVEDSLVITLLLTFSLIIGGGLGAIAKRPNLRQVVGVNGLAANRRRGWQQR